LHSISLQAAVSSRSQSRLATTAIGRDMRELAQ